MWQDLMDRFGVMSTRFDSSNASPELIVMLLGSFILGFLFCYVRGKSKARGIDS